MIEDYVRSITWLKSKFIERGKEMRSKEEIIEDIEQIVVSKIQPTVAMHGGVVSLHSFNDGVATMFMSGACSGC